MYSFQRESDWTRRVEIVRSFEKPELKQLGLRTIYVNAPEALPEHIRTKYHEVISENRHGLKEDMPWNTVGSLMKEVHERLLDDPEDEEVLNIKAWALETYPQAADWRPAEDLGETPQEEVSEEAAAVAPAADAPSEDVSTTEVKEEVEEPVYVLPAAMKSSVAGIHFLDGLD